MKQVKLFYAIYALCNKLCIPFQQQFDLTPEELRVIRECSREGIFTRALPLGVLFGIGGLVGAKAGPLMNAKFGVKPAVIGFGILGYFVGRMTYSKVCFQRALQVPDGNLRKMFPHLVKDKYVSFVAYFLKNCRLPLQEFFNA